jgi:hypothetical protein
MKKRLIILFLLLFYGAGFNDAFAQYNPPDTSQLVYHAPALAQIVCSFDYTSSEIVITPCTYTGMVSVTVTNIDTGAIALFTMASLSGGEERIPFFGYPGYYLAEIEILSGSGRKYALLFNN